MGLLDRAPRAAASALLLAAAIGAAGTTGISSVLAVDPPATIALTGTVVDESGAALAGVHLVIAEEQTPDGALAGFQAVTGADGSFAADVYAWGTTEAPARLTISAPQDEEITIVGKACSRTVGVAVADSRDVALEAGTETLEPFSLVARTTVVGEICGTVASAPPPKPVSNSGSNNSGRGSTGGATLTPPPTDALRTALAPAADRTGPALALGFGVGLAAAIALLRPRHGAPRRR